MKTPAKRLTSKAQLQLLDSFNKTDCPYDASQTIVSLFRAAAAAHPDLPALVYKDVRMTYREVDSLTDRLAAVISDKGLGREDVVSVLIPRCEWMALASIGVLKAGCAYQPLDPSYPPERLNFMMKDASAKLLIADASLRDIVNEYKGETLLLQELPDVLGGRAEPSREALEAMAPTPESLFILLYTSGTTGVPKGCQLEHRNLVAYCNWARRYYELGPGCMHSAYASYGFDACMMELYPSLTSGACVHIISEDIRLNLLEVNAYFEANGITHAFMTTQVAYQFATLVENHSLRHLSTGGEKLASLNPPAGYKFHNCYGPTECTICCTAYVVNEYEDDVPIGAALDNIRFYVVNEKGKRVPPGAPGELWVSGPQVGRGYLNRPDKTAEVFIDNPFDDDPAYARIYRTGDIVRYRPDGNLQFVGRSDGQVKIRGFRIELKEVETVIRQFPGIKDVTVQAFDDEAAGGKFIAAYIVAEEKVDITALNNFILSQKPPYMVPAVTMQIDRIPLNQNQKVDRKALPRPRQEGSAAFIPGNEPPRDDVERELKEMVAAIVGHGDFGRATPLGYTGLTSISSIKFAIQVNKRWGVILDPKALVKEGTIASVRGEIARGGAPASKSAASPAKKFEPAPLAYSQRGVYFDCMTRPDSVFYNISCLLGFSKKTAPERIEAALKTLVAVHPELTVHFEEREGEIVQVADPSRPVEVVHSERSEKELKTYKNAFVRPFDLEKGPLYRFETVSTPSRTVLLLDIHHLVIDGGSLDLFLTQLCDLLNGREIDSEQMNFSEFAAAEKEAEDGPAYEEAKAFFAERLGAVEGSTDIPSDLPNPVSPGMEKNVYSALDFPKIEAFCRARDITPAHFTLAAVLYTLSRFAAQEQICIATISNGRSNLLISSTVGMFVNTLALSAKIGEGSVRDFLQQTSSMFEETLRHENYPYTQIAADYGLSPDIIFAYQMGVLEQYVCDGESLDLEDLELDIPKFHFAFYIREQEGIPSVCIDYDNGRYSEALAQSLADSVANAASAFIRNPDAPLKEVSLLSPVQCRRLDGFNATDMAYDASQTIVSLFRAAAAAHPDSTAVVYKEVRLSYREVDSITDRLAAVIADKGLGREDVVSVLIPRCEWMALASLGVLKAGCAYQPLDPGYPPERLNFMMQDACAKLLIADASLRDIVNEYKGETLLLQELPDILGSRAEPSREALEAMAPTPESLFILLYTSGTTGVPKGCQLEHRNLVAFCHWYCGFYKLGPGCAAAAYASYGFDACMMDLYPALTSGACVHIIDEDIRLNLPDVNAYFEANHITHSFMTTQVGFQFAGSLENHSLRCLSTGGEKLPAMTPPKGYRFFNCYGPTECTIFSTVYPLEEAEKDIPIGKPLGNLRLYVVDTQGARLPLGALGELWVSGPQVGRGYLNRPEKTAEVFIDNPFDSDPAHSRIYRTGDIVRYLPDGNIQFVGRSDAQVKIRGFRIELKEVESVIRQFPKVKDVTVQAYDYEGGGKYIAAFIVSDNPVNVAELNAFIAERKPSYMVPAVTMQIDRIPLNQNQKVDRRALPKPVPQAATGSYEAPENPVEQSMADIFASVLSLDKVGATDNFFDLGGTSLMVTRVIIEADKAGHHIAYRDLFDHPTPRLLARFLGGEGTAAQVENDPEITDYDYSAIESLLLANNLDSFKRGKRLKIGNVLLTGATGFLGIHVLHELLARASRTVYCLVRGRSVEDSTKRLQALLFYYFNTDCKDLIDSGRIRVVQGDVTQDIDTALGSMDKDAPVDTVINCAANVKHFSEGTDIEDVNIGGARRCVEFCLRRDARLIHISTCSTGGLNVGNLGSDTVLREDMLYFGQYLDNPYIHSKFLSERLVLEAVAERDLVGKVIRVGNLSPRSSDGEFQINFQTNSAMGRVRAYELVGGYPYEDAESPMEFSPIDEVARSILLLGTTPKECCVFQSFNNHSVFFGDVLDELKVIGKQPVPMEAKEFARALEKVKNDPGKAPFLTGLLAYQDMAHGKQACETPYRNEYTSQVLYRLGFKWSPTSWDYVDQFLVAISKLGYFNVSRGAGADK